MKRKSIVLLALLGLIGIVTFVSCNKDEDGKAMITVNGEASALLKMAVSGDAQTVTVNGVEAWSAEASEWITIDRVNGEGNRDVEVTITVEANEGEERLGSVVFSLPGGEFAMVSVVQPQGEAK